MTGPRANPDPAAWPALPLDAWEDTYRTLHMWTQVVGKVRLGLTPWINHSWHVPMYVTPRGLTTSSIPCGPGSFEVRFDFVDHRLRVDTSAGDTRFLPLEPRSVADFYREVMDLLRGLGIRVEIRPVPVEVEEAVPFPEDRDHASYDREHVDRFRRVLVQSDRVLREFRAEFIGKCSPVHFFWGSFDLAVTRFSGRRAPEHPGGIPNLPDWVAREAYSHEVSSAGWWPGGGAVREPAYYSYMYPEPDGFRGARVRPEAGYYQQELGEFVLPYDAVRTAADPDAALLAFLRDTYAAGADRAGWDRAALERAG